MKKYKQTELFPNGEVPEVLNQRQAMQVQSKGEVNTMPSQTMPGQSMTIKEIVARYRQGLPVDQKVGEIYQGEEVFKDLNQMDLIDRQAYVDSVADALVEVKEKIKADAKTKEEKELLDRIDKEVKEKLSLLRKEKKEKLEGGVQDEVSD